jgi:hypothetical protein
MQNLDRFKKSLNPVMNPNLKIEEEITCVAMRTQSSARMSSVQRSRPQGPLAQQPPAPAPLRLRTVARPPARSLRQPACHLLRSSAACAHRPAGHLRCAPAPRATCAARTRGGLRSTPRAAPARQPAPPRHLRSSARAPQPRLSAFAAPPACISGGRARERNEVK